MNAAARTRRLVFRAVQTLLLPTLALAGAVALAPGRTRLAIHLYALVVSAAALVALLAALRRAYPAAPRRSLVDAVLEQRAAPEERLPELARLEREVTLAGSNAFDLHFRLRPVLRETAAGLLASRRGVDLDRQPERARALLGETAWNLVRADVDPPSNRRGPGIAIVKLREVVEALERIA